MKLDENYSTNFDGIQWVLSYEKVSIEVNPKTGKPTISKNNWYHAKLEDSIKSYIDKKLANNETVEDTIKGLKVLLEEVKSLKIDIQK